MNTKLALIFLLVSISDLSHALYGARPVSKSYDYSSVVTLHLNDPNNSEYDFFCSGVLVATDTVLTTGHCIEVMGNEVYEQWSFFTYNPENMKVKAKGVSYEVSDVILAPGYTESFGFEGEDLALIRLKKPLKSMKPFKIAPKNVLKAGTPVTMVAKGMIADTKITAQKIYGQNTVIFTDGTKSGVCSGDSGGALLVKVGNEEMLAGILSAQTEGCERRTGVSVFPRILK
jgi:secreted trypsin-like serine protease